jgi:cystathionine gamma-lyase/cystathionine beta-lyase/cystathionine gamma-lyase/homocysteine desulfhydrase
VKLPTDARFGTLCIHAGQEPEPATGAIIPPIFQTSTYVQDALGKHKGYEYGRTQNPTRAALEANVAALEGGRAGFAFASGMAAIGAIASLLQAGDHTVVTDNTYGGTYRLFERVLRRYNLEFTYIDTSQAADVQAAMRSTTRLVFLETPTNPMMQVADIARIAEIAHAGGVLVAVDNTFASPYVQQPIRLGADLVIHSTTKYLNGHSDGIGGVVIANGEKEIEWLRFVQNAAGAILAPFESWLVLRGTKTLALRMPQHNANGLALAQYLARHPKVQKVFYPGLPDHPQHELARRQMRGFGGMLSFELGSLEAARAVLDNVRLMALAESLGGVETLICHPATMTHASVPDERKRRLGISDGLVRISVGVEDIEDLKADLDQALARIGRSSL